MTSRNQKRRKETLHLSREKSAGGALKQRRVVAENKRRRRKLQRNVRKRPTARSGKCALRPGSSTTRMRTPIASCGHQHGRGHGAKDAERLEDPPVLVIEKDELFLSFDSDS